MKGLKLLVVEDDLASLELMAEVFTSLEADVRPMNDAAEAANAVQAEKFDGIFLDLEMPKVHGLDIARGIRKSSWNKTTPIIIVTGREQRQTMQEAFAIGATYFLQKPIDRQKLGKLFRTVRGGMLDNRRRYTRFPLHTEVVCHTGSRTIRGMIWNISFGGLQVELADLRPGDSVRLSWCLPVSGLSIKVTGRVMWTEQSRQGIQFVKMSTQVRRIITEFLAKIEAE